VADLDWLARSPDQRPSRRYVEEDSFKNARGASAARADSEPEQHELG
jgi:hypothetical protein